jgi:ribosomal protein L7/L12
MAFVIECRNPYNEENVDFTGPFNSESEAEIFLMLPVMGSILHCQRNHKIHELVAPSTEKIDFATLMRVVEQAKAGGRKDKAVELAQNAIPFWADEDGNRHFDVTFEDIRDNMITTVKALRRKYDGIGLKESKDIVTQWRDNLNSCFHMYSEYNTYCTECGVLVK